MSSSILGAGYRPHPSTRGLMVSLDRLTVEARRLSAHDAELILPTLPREETGVLRVQLGRRDVSYPVSLSSVAREGGEIRVTVQSAIRDRATLRPLLELFAELRDGNLVTVPLEGTELDEETEPRERLERLLISLGRLHDDVRVRSIGAPNHPWRIDGGLPDDQSRWPSQHFDVDVRTPLVDYSFRVGPQRNGPRSISVVRIGARSEARVPAPRRLEVVTTHPMLAGERLTLPVRYVSRTELICEHAPESDLLYPGLSLTQSDITWVGGRMAAMLKVRDVYSESGTALASIEVFPESMDDAWGDEVDGLCHPNTFIDSIDAPEVWDLYAESGYFSISGCNEAEFVPQRQAFIEASARIAAHPELGAQVKWRSGRSLDGTVTFLKAFEESALVYQLARGPKRAMHLSGHRALYDLYRRALEHSLRHGVNWIAVYVQKEGARFSRLVNRDFPATHASNPLVASQVSFRPWQIETSATRIETPLEIDTPSSRELNDWLKKMEKHRPYSYLQTLDLVPERANCVRAQERFARAGLFRHRAFRVARRDGLAVGMAYYDFMDDGVHLFGLFDAVRVYPFEGSEPMRAEVIAALLSDAQTHYARAGKRRFVYFDETMGESPVEGAVNLGDADLSCFSTRLSSEWLEEVAIATSGGR